MIADGPPARRRRLPRTFYARDVLAVAPELLNKLLVRDDGRVARIVEVEAYRDDDPASHSFRGPTRRNAVMFGPPGLLYVYFTYGVHWCANVVCGREGEGTAALVRAVEPVAGIEAMRIARRGPPRDTDIGSGPAKLAQALGIDGSFDGADLVQAGRIWIADDGVPPPDQPAVATRIGITKAIDQPWRWYVPGNPHVSRLPRRGG